MSQRYRHSEKRRMFWAYILGFPKTLYYNLRLLPWCQARRFPIWVSHRTRIRCMGGRIDLRGPLSTAMLKLGIENSQVNDFRAERTLITLLGTWIVGGRSTLGAGSKVFIEQGACLQTGQRLVLATRSSILCLHQICLGDDAMISWDCLITDSDQHAIYNQQRERINPDQPVIWGDRVWCGCRCTITKGTRLENDVIIGADSRLSTAYPQSGVIIAGNPAHIIKENIFWK